MKMTNEQFEAILNVIDITSKDLLSRFDINRTGILSVMKSYEKERVLSEARALLVEDEPVEIDEPCEIRTKSMVGMKYYDPKEGFFVPFEWSDEQKSTAFDLFKGIALGGSDTVDGFIYSLNQAITKVFANKEDKL